MPRLVSPLVYVIVVNWNGKHHLQNCLPSLIATDYGNFRVVLVDNGSTDGSQQWLRETFPQVELLALEHNVGFAAANNAALRKALENEAPYAVLLNNDTRVDQNWLDHLIQTVESDPNVAICQSRQRTWDGRNEVRFRYIPEWAEATQEIMPVTLPTPPAPVSFASGCAMLLRCSALSQIGLFDERYFMYVEDVDMSLRAWIAGYQVIDVPASIVYHHGTGSPSTKLQRMHWGYRNQLSTLIKLYQLRTLRQYAQPILKRWFLTKNRYALFGTLNALRMLPGTLSRRHRINSQRLQPDVVFLELSEG